MIWVFPALQTYIQDVRNCSTKEQEKERVDKELGKIRKKYTSDKGLTGAQPALLEWHSQRDGSLILLLRLGLRPCCREGTGAIDGLRPAASTTCAAVWNPYGYWPLCRL